MKTYTVYTVATISLLVVLLAGWAVPVVEALTLGDVVNLFLGPLWNIFVQSTCNTISGNFNDGYRLGCKCRGLFNTGGLGGQLICQNDANYCLVNGELYCGSTALQLDFSLREGITDLNGCFEIESNLPSNLQIGPSERIPVCVNVVPTGTDFKFKSCNIEWAGEQCASCTVCANERDFKFDCSNVNVNPLGSPLVEGPTLTECEGFGFLDDI